MKILVVEDEKKVQTFIKQALEQAGMVVDAASTVDDMNLMADTTEYDIIVLDRMLGREDSVKSIDSLCKKNPDVKILVLSALGDVDEKVKGLTEGADDYIAKPFHVSELVARVRALSRRRENGRAMKDTMIEFGDLMIDLEKQRVSRGEKKIDLTKKEFQILTLLARRPGVVFSKANILDRVWDMNHFPESNIVEVTIANLRNKVDKGFEPLIQSQRGVGYWFRESM